MGLIRAVTITKATRKVDKTATITVTTNIEESPEDLMEVDKLIGRSGIWYFSEKGTLTKQETDEIDKVEIEVEGKTKSQRLRSVLYVYCQQEGKDFKEFYASEMDRIIEHYKDKLEDR